MKEIITNNHLQFGLDEDELDFQERCKKHFKGTQINELSKLRDHFAASFIQGFCGNSECYPTELHHFANIAEDAYKMADAMMKERTK